MTVEKGNSQAPNAGTVSAIPQPTRFVGRQPIFDARRHVVGYELLFRSGWENSFQGEADDAARQTLDNCLVMGIESLADNGLAFVNCTREALVGKLVALLPPATTVLEILESVEPDDELVEACRVLRRMGYVLALDDFVPRPEMRPLIEIASFIKIDYRASDARMRREIRDLVQGSGAALLAEKVETQQEFDQAVTEGCEYFQGYFFCRPKIITHREIPRNSLNYLNLLAELSRTPLNLIEIIAIVQAEASICYRLLRLANSAMMGVRREVTSVCSALILVGEDRFRTLVTLALSGALGRGSQSALIRLSLERARFCELMAPLTGEDPREQYMLGLLSLLDAILESPMDGLVKSLPLREEAKQALLGVANPAAHSLSLIRSFEAGDWGPCAGAAQELGVTEDHLAGIYVTSLNWAAEALASSD